MEIIGDSFLEIEEVIMYLSIKMSYKRSINENTKKDQGWDTLTEAIALRLNSPVKSPFL